MIPTRSQHLSYIYSANINFQFEGIQYRRYTGFNQMAAEDKQTHIYKPLEIGNIYALFAITLLLYFVYFIVVQSVHSHVYNYYSDIHY